MAEQHDQSEFEARLPEDPAYWSALTERIASSAEPVFAELLARQAWWNPLDRFGPALSVGAIAAAAAMFVALPSAGPAAGPDAAEPVRTAVSPTDLLENVFTTPGAPDLMTLMVAGNEEDQ